VTAPDSVSLRIGWRALAVVTDLVQPALTFPVRKLAGNSYNAEAYSEGCFVVLGRIEYRRCGLLQLMIPASVSQSATKTGRATTAERIDVPLGEDTLGDPQETLY